MCEEAAVAKREILSRNLPRRTEEDHKKRHLVHPVPSPRNQCANFQIRCYSVTHSTTGIPAAAAAAAVVVVVIVAAVVVVVVVVVAAAAALVVVVVVVAAAAAAAVVVVVIVVVVVVLVVLVVSVIYCSGDYD
jgi:hypothetical protein